MQLDLVAGREHRHRLVDHVFLVQLELVHRAALDELDDPTRVEVDAEADAAAVLAEVLDCEPESAGAGRTEHQPVRALREVRVGQRLGEALVVERKSSMFVRVFGMPVVPPVSNV